MRSSLVTRNSNPFSFIEDFETDLARIFGNYPPTRRANIVPAMDLAEKESHFVLSVDLPGVKKEDLQIEVDANILSIKGERKKQQETSEYSERSFGPFERKIQLPQSVKTEDIEARFENGVLELAIPKERTRAKTTVEIKDGSQNGLWDRLTGKTDSTIAS